MALSIFVSSLALCMEFQSGQNCVTEIKDMLCAKYLKTVCYIESVETSCTKYANIMLKMRKHYAQNAETLCSKCRNVMLKTYLCNMIYA